MTKGDKFLALARKLGGVPCSVLAAPGAPTIKADDFLELTIPIRTYSPNGQHGHWSKVSKRRKQLREAVTYGLRGAFGMSPPFVPAQVIIITRIGPRRMDSDNAAFSVKGARDAIADWLGIDDGDDAVEWIVRREIGDFGVRIEIRRTT